tara:strand:+ start:253 stop:615 length:363 start_codon:yes stop_codon:yes gene_type:complete
MPVSFEVNDYDQTVKIFNNFYTADLVVPASEWDVVYSYFVGTSNPTSASAFASVLFRISQESGVEVMTLLEDIQGKSQNNKLELSQSMAFYLNLIRSKTALYGVSTVPSPNQSVQRNVLQ